MNRLNDYILGEIRTGKGARYDRIVESTSVGFAAMSKKEIRR